MVPRYEDDPVIQTVSELRELTNAILGSLDDEVRPQDVEPITWTDPTSGLDFSILRNFMGQPLILTGKQGDWENGTRYESGFAGLTIVSNERPVPGLSFRERFEGVIAAMRAKLESEA